MLYLAILFLPSWGIHLGTFVTVLNQPSKYMSHFLSSTNLIWLFHGYYCLTLMVQWIVKHYLCQHQVSVMIYVTAVTVIDIY